MTVSSNRGTQVTVNQFVLDAWKLAGIVDVDASESEPQLNGKMAFGRRKLGSILKREGAISSARLLDWEYVTLTANTQSYMLDAGIYIVVGDGSYIDPDETSTTAPDEEDVVTQLTMPEWQTLQSKSTTGTPDSMYPHRGGSGYAIELFLYPIPDAAGTLRLVVHREMAETDSGEQTLDVKGFYNEYLMHELAAQLCLASNGSAGKLRDLRSSAATMRREARGAAVPQNDVTVDVDLGHNFLRR